MEFVTRLPRTLHKLPATGSWHPAPGVGRLLKRDPHTLSGGVVIRTSCSSLILYPEGSNLIKAVTGFPVRLRVELRKAYFGIAAAGGAYSLMVTGCNEET